MGSNSKIWKAGDLQAVFSRPEPIFGHSICTEAIISVQMQFVFCKLYLRTAWPWVRETVNTELTFFLCLRIVNPIYHYSPVQVPATPLSHTAKHLLKHSTEGWERWWHLEWYTVSFDKCHISESISNTARMQALEQQWVDARLKWHMDKLDKGQEN